MDEKHLIVYGVLALIPILAGIGSSIARRGMDKPKDKCPTCGR